MMDPVFYDICVARGATGRSVVILSGSSDTRLLEIGRGCGGSAACVGGDRGCGDPGRDGGFDRYPIRNVGCFRCSLWRCKICLREEDAEVELGDRVVVVEDRSLGSGHSVVGA